MVIKCNVKIVMYVYVMNLYLIPVYDDHADFVGRPVVVHETLDYCLQCFKRQLAADHQMTSRMQRHAYTCT